MNEKVVVDYFFTDEFDPDWTREQTIMEFNTVYEKLKADDDIGTNDDAVRLMFWDEYNKRNRSNYCAGAFIIDHGVIDEFIKDVKRFVGLAVDMVNAKIRRD